ncbi:hypothetical protein Tco_0101026 [Tanacetum coccineum]
MIVKENFHVQFSENSPNIAGSGPNSLFNIDALTKSMNYKTVVAGNQSNGNVGEDEKKVNEEPGKEGGDSSNDQDTNNVNTVSLTINVASIEDNDVDENIVYGYADDPNIPELEDIVYSDDDQVVGVEADMNNLDAFMPVSPIPTTRIHKDYPVDQIIGDLNLAPQTRIMTKNVSLKILSRTMEVRS